METKKLALEKRLQDIRDSIAAPVVVFTIGVTEDRGVDIINVKAIHGVPEQAPEDVESGEASLDDDMSDFSSYIG